LLLLANTIKFPQGEKTPYRKKQLHNGAVVGAVLGRQSEAKWALGNPSPSVHWHMNSADTKFKELVTNMLTFGAPHEA
jgi:hypothetical protein